MRILPLLGLLKAPSFFASTDTTPTRPLPKSKVEMPLSMLDSISHSAKTMKLPGTMPNDPQKDILTHHKHLTKVPFEISNYVNMRYEIDCFFSQEILGFSIDLKVQQKT